MFYRKRGRMTTQEAIEILQNDIQWSREDRYPYISKVKVTALKKAVEALEQSRWIPIAEKQPEEFRPVLICIKLPEGISQCVATRLLDDNGNSVWTTDYNVEPIAWQPLPEPYKPESEDKE